MLLGGRTRLGKCWEVGHPRLPWRWEKRTKRRHHRLGAGDPWDWESEQEWGGEEGGERCRVSRGDTRLG